jgi:hypothetical protein
VIAAAAASAESGSAVELDLAAPRSAIGGVVSVDEFGLIGAALLDVLGRARPLTAADLVLPTVDVSGVARDAVDLGLRVDALEQALRQLLDDLSGDLDTRIAALMRCATLGVARSIAAIEAGAAGEALDPVRTELKRRLLVEDETPRDPIPKDATRPRRPRDDPRRPEPKGPPPVEQPPRDPVEEALSRLRRLGGEAVPILPLFTPAADPGRVAAAGSEQRQQQVADAGRTWLRHYGRARPDLGAAVDLLLLAESASGRSLDPFGLAELPHREGPWAAVDRPSDGDDRLSIVALTGADALGIDAAPVAGLVFDSWVDAIPRGEQQTGVAVHFDAPTARPPQAVLLSLVDGERGFSEAEVADQLLHTIELAKLRAVDPRALGGVGHYLPTAFLPDDLVISGGEPA